MITEGYEFEHEASLADVALSELGSLGQTPCRDIQLASSIIDNKVAFKAHLNRRNEKT